MSDNFRYVRGETKPVSAKVATAQSAEIGDLVGLSSNTLVKASDTTWDTDLITTQTAFVALFLGVAMQRKVANVANCGPGSGEDNRIRVATGGIYRFACASGTFNMGALVGPAKQSGNALENQKVAVAVLAGAIGRIAKQYDTAVTEVEVEVFSEQMAPTN